MILVTTLSTCSMMMETPETQRRVMQQPYLQVMDYVFVVAMGLELGLKVSSFYTKILNLFIKYYFKQTLGYKLIFFILFFF
jgi:hypothetical protein